jgi:hypothetical protein
MRPPLAAIFVACLSVSATAQPAFDPTEFIDKKVLHKVDVDQLWRTLGISGKIRETTAGGAKDTDQNFNCAQDDRCEAQFISLNWGLPDSSLVEGGGDAVVRIAPDYLNANLRRFLILSQREQGGAWRLVDYLDLTEWDYDQPEISVVSSGGRGWLVVKAWPHCGTGCSLIHTDWYELKGGKLRMVLTVPLAGTQGNENPSRSFETRFVRASQSGDRETLEFVYHIVFGPGLSSTVDSDLWEDEKFIRFSRPSGQGEFKFDAKNSELSEAFVRKMFSSLEAGSQRFEILQDRLLGIARRPNDRDLDWLKELLEQNPNVPQLTRVRAAIGKTP